MRTQRSRPALLTHVFAHLGRTCLGVALVCLVPLTAIAQNQAEHPTELIPVNNVSMQSAYTLANNICVQARNAGTDMNSTACFNVEILGAESMLAVTATPEVIGRIASMLSEFDRLPLTRSFQIVVLAADRSGNVASGLSAEVRQAVEDLQGFLPYTGFRELGSGWLRTSGYGETSLPGPMDLSAEIRFRQSSNASEPVLIERFSVSRRVAVPSGPDGSFVEHETRPLMQSTFTINPGETVVVGTSKLNGDDSAVVVLLTVVQN